MKRDTVVECALRPGGLPDYVCENEQRSAIYSVADSVHSSHFAGKSRQCSPERFNLALRWCTLLTLASRILALPPDHYLVRCSVLTQIIRVACSLSQQMALLFDSLHFSLALRHLSAKGQKPSSHLPSLGVIKSNDHLQSRLSQALSSSTDWFRQSKKDDGTNWLHSWLPPIVIVSISDLRSR